MPHTPVKPNSGLLSWAEACFEFEVCVLPKPWKGAQVEKFQVIRPTHTDAWYQSSALFCSLHPSLPHPIGYPLSWDTNCIDDAAAEPIAKASSAALACLISSGLQGLSYLISDPSYFPLAECGSITTAVSASPHQRMSSNSFWFDACTYATGKPLQTLVNAAYSSCGATVRRARAAAAARAIHVIGGACV